MKDPKIPDEIPVHLFEAPKQSESLPLHPAFKDQPTPTVLPWQKFWTELRKKKAPAHKPLHTY